MKERNLYIEAICGLLILLFFYASVSKLIDIKHSFVQMNNQPMPNWMTPYLAIGIPVMEILVAIGLMTDKFRLKALYTSAIMLTAFTIYVSLAVFNIFPRIPCSCGGVIQNLNWTQHLYFNLFFLGINIVAIFLMRKRNRNSQRNKSIDTNLYFGS